MDLLITLIGNAVADPVFRARFLENPIDIVEHYRFRLTKGEHEMLEAVFVGLTPKEKEEFEGAFLALQNIVYAKLATKEPCTPPCKLSLFPPPELRTTQPKLEKVTPLHPRRTGTHR